MPSAAIEPPANTPAKRVKARTLDYAKAAALKAQGYSWGDIAPMVGAANANVIRTRMSQLGISSAIIAQKRVSLPQAVSGATAALELLSGQSRKSAASVVNKHLEALDKVKAKPNLKHLKAVGEALEPLVRSADKVHGWSSQEEAGLVTVNTTETLLIEQSSEPEALADMPSQQAIDVDCTPGQHTSDVHTDPVDMQGQGTVGK